MSIIIKPIRGKDAQDQGRLLSFEATKDIPFEIKRVYYVVDAPEGTQRGGHAHKKLQQFLFCPYGKVDILLDDGESKHSVMLALLRQAYAGYAW